MKIAGMTIDIRNGLSPSHVRLLTAIAVLQARRTTVTIKKLIKVLGVRSPNGIMKALDGLEKTGLISREKFTAASIVPHCRFYTYEELNPREATDGTVGDNAVGVDGQASLATEA